VCVKRALPRLRVAQLWEAPVERNRYEWRWMQAAARIAPGCAPRVLAHDEAGFFAMEYLDGARFRCGRTSCEPDARTPRSPRRSARAGAHPRRATAGDAALAAEFATDAGFHAIRLEPYLLATARRHAELAAPLERLAERTAATRAALVHGDVSPKNILVGPEGPVFLDAECAWYGDPAFDLAFCLNHLLLKCLWVPRAQARFLACFDAFAAAYLEAFARDGVQARAASLLPGLLIARVDGKSPVEYVTGDAQKDRVRRLARTLLLAPPATLAEVRDAWQGS
jgi:aminoglycoside phosphotransferase (APT) family kinase protein